MGVDLTLSGRLMKMVTKVAAARVERRFRLMCDKLVRFGFFLLVSILAYC